MSNTLLNSWNLISSNGSLISAAYKEQTNNAENKKRPLIKQLYK